MKENICCGNCEHYCPNSNIDDKYGICKEFEAIVSYLRSPCGLYRERKAVLIMAEYIDREKAFKLFTEQKVKETGAVSKGLNKGLNIARSIVNNKEVLPTADVVEVVRKAVKGYEGYYEVDQFGRVYSVNRVISVNDNGRKYNKLLKSKQMKQAMHTKGYKTVALTKDGKTKSLFVHRIVAEAFIPNENNLPMVNHKDEDKTNNFVENLEWCTASYNRTYGNAIEKQAKKLRGKKHTEEHKSKISISVKNRLLQLRREKE